MPPKAVWLLRETGCDLGADERKYKTGVLARDASIYCPPWCSRRALRIRTLIPRQHAALESSSEKPREEQSPVQELDDPNFHVVREIGPDFDVGVDKWRRAVLGSDGNVYCPPYNAGSVLMIQTPSSPIDGSEPGVKLLGPDFGDVEAKWRDAVSGVDGSIYCVPWCANRVLRISPSSSSVELIGPDFGATPDKWKRALMGNDGRLFCVPFNASQVLCIDTSTGSVELIGPDLGLAEGKWWMSLKVRGDVIFCPPYNASKILRIDTSTCAIEFFGSDLGPVKAKYWSAVEADDGSIYCAPCCAAKVLRIDTNLGMAQLIGIDHCIGGHKWRKGYLGHDGSIYILPWNASCVLKVDVHNGSVHIMEPDFGYLGAKFVTGFLLQDGTLVSAPHNMAALLRIDTTCSEIDLFGNLSEATKPRCGEIVLGADEKLYTIPLNATQVYRVDPIKPHDARSAGRSLSDARMYVVDALAGQDGS